MQIIEANTYPIVIAMLFILGPVCWPHLRSIVIPNRLWITIYIYVLKIQHNFEINCNGPVEPVQSSWHSDNR